MAKWSGVYLEDCHKLLKKIEKELDHVVGEEKRRYGKWGTWEDGTSMVQYDFREGRQQLAEQLIDKIKKWRKEMYNE